MEGNMEVVLNLPQGITVELRIQGSPQLSERMGRPKVTKKPKKSDYQPGDEFNFTPVVRRGKNGKPITRFWVTDEERKKHADYQRERRAKQRAEREGI